MSDYEKQLEAANKNLEEQLIQAKKDISKRLFKKFTVEFTKRVDINPPSTKPLSNIIFRVKIGNIHIANIHFSNDKYTLITGNSDHNRPKFKELDDALNAIFKELTFDDMVITSDMNIHFIEKPA